MPRISTEHARPERVAFGRRVRWLRMQAGLTQTAAAAACGMDRSFYVDVETARYSASVDKIFDIARGLGVSPVELFTDLDVEQ